MCHYWHFSECSRNLARALDAVHITVLPVMMLKHTVIVLNGKTHCLNLFISGPARDADAAKRFFLKMYEDLHHGHPKSLYRHYTCATDTDNIRKVFKDVKHAILKENMATFNLMWFVASLTMSACRLLYSVFQVFHFIFYVMTSCLLYCCLRLVLGKTNAGYDSSVGFGIPVNTESTPLWLS